MGASHSSRVDHSHKHLRRATRRANAHSAHYKLLEQENEETRELSRSAHNAFHDAMHEAHELSSGCAHHHKSSVTVGADATTYDDEEMARDLASAQLASEHWPESYAQKINNGDGLRAHLVFGTEVPLDAEASEASAQSILSRYGQ